MRYLFFLIIIMFLFKFNINFGKAYLKIQNTYIEDTIKTHVSNYMQKYKIPGIAIALYVNGKPYLFNFGYSNKKNKILITNETLFEIGSISKIFTCLLVAQQVLENNWNLHDPISRYISELSNNKCLKTITLEKLATHTSTLPFNAPSNIKTKNSLLRYISRYKPLSTSTCFFQYSNHGVELLRIALEEKLQQSFDDILKNRILMPLKMNIVGTRIPPIYYNHYASCYDKNGDETIYWDHPFLIGSAAIRASSSDMLKFLHAALGLPGTPISIENAMCLTQTPFIKIKKNGAKHGLGWEINSIKNFYKAPSFNFFSKIEVQKIKDKKFGNNVILDKGGTTNGFHSYIAVSPSEKTGIVIMINRTLPNGWNVIKNLGKHILLNINNKLNYV